MRKLLLVGALCLGTAGAINLSGYKREDVCLTEYSIWSIPNRLDYRDTESLQFSLIQRNQLEQRIEKEGLLKTIGKDCKIYLMFDANTLQFSNSSLTFVHSELILIDQKGINTVNGLRINNVYSADSSVDSKLASDIQFKVYVLYDTLLTRFLLDWEAARP